jgi:hypothetical protein
MQFVFDVRDECQAGRDHHGERPICRRHIQLTLRFIQMRLTVSAFEFCQEPRIGEAGVQSIRRLRVERIERVDGGGELPGLGVVVARCVRFNREQRQRRTGQNPGEQSAPPSGLPRSQEILRVPLSGSGLGGAVAIRPWEELVAKSNKLRICNIVVVVQGLAARGVVVVVMICSGKPGCRMFFRGMFARNRVVGMHGVRTCGAMIRQSGAVTPQCGTPRTGCRGVTAQAATPAVAASASTRMSATAAATGVSTATAATATATAGVSTTAA